MSNNSNYFSLQLSKLLSALGKSQKDLSINANISESKLSKLLSGKVEPKFNDISNISKVLNVSPSFFFYTDSDSQPVEIGYVLGTRIYTVLYNNKKQRTLILMGRSLESSTWVPIESLEFLSDMKSMTIFSITLVSGVISVDKKSLVRGIPLMLYKESIIDFSIGSNYILQIIGEVGEFSDFMKKYLSPEKIIDF